MQSAWWWRRTQAAPGRAGRRGEGLALCAPGKWGGGGGGASGKALLSPSAPYARKYCISVVNPKCLVQEGGSLWPRQPPDLEGLNLLSVRYLARG